MNLYVRTFGELMEEDIETVGGKAANLIALEGVDGIRVPGGFCVTTNAYERMFTDNDRLSVLVDELETIEAADTRKVLEICDQMQGEIRSARIPTEIAAAVKDTLAQFDDGVPWAVRSSATAEDLPTASFAGQHDTYLNVVGTDSVLEHISRCWASLFTPRAVTYRLRNGFAHSQVHLAVVVQRLVIPEVAGIMFTADPLTSDRRVVSIDAGYGLGEAFVSGRARVDTYKVKDGAVIDRTISPKESALRASAGGGTHDEEIEADARNVQALTDDQVLRLARLGRKIEEVFGRPQDIEWCLQDNEFFVVQSRPITTLYPLAPGNGPRVYISGGHLQMMTDPIKPLGIFFFAAVSGEACSHSVGGRLYLDITHDLASPIGRKLSMSVLNMVGDSLLYDGLRQLAERRGFLKSLPRGKEKVFALKFEGGAMGVLRHGFKAYRKNDPETVQVLINRNEEMIQELRAEIASLSGTELLDFIAEDQRHLRANVAFAEAAGALTAGLLTARRFDKKMEKWLGEKGASDTIIQSVPNSITTDTGYALLDVADAVRPYPAVMDYLQTATDETFFEGLKKVDGGDVVSEQFRAYLDTYGVRCTGDIDITRDRWYEEPTALVPTILNNIKNFEPGARARRTEEGLRESEQRIQDLANRLEKLPGGKAKAKKARKWASVIRNHIGYREFPKFAYMQRYKIYKEALLEEADKLVEKGVLEERKDIYYLTFAELRAAIASGVCDTSVLPGRKEDHLAFENLTPPRVMTSHGEVVAGRYDSRDRPAGALPGIAVSAGVIEGRARVIMSLGDVDLEEGDILVTRFTDPSWTPVFASIRALVTEVGGVSTHGAIIAREYGLPAVVSVENATGLIQDGQMIRVSGTEGYVEILS